MREHTYFYCLHPIINFAVLFTLCDTLEILVILLMLLWCSGSALAYSSRGPVFDLWTPAIFNLQTLLHLRDLLERLVQNCNPPGVSRMPRQMHHSSRDYRLRRCNRRLVEQLVQKVAPGTQSRPKPPSLRLSEDSSLGIIDLFEMPQHGMLLFGSATMVSIAIWVYFAWGWCGDYLNWSYNACLLIMRSTLPSVFYSSYWSTCVRTFRHTWVWCVWTVVSRKICPSVWSSRPTHLENFIKCIYFYFCAKFVRICYKFIY